ncbi:hypothetical protein F4820DRAFT_379745 [Hypoxylon rubiginosum]|uniref:Uncharacterized protein n=1 Tax=Hypoxylon rubiginosum TaxID=110542 RepID=A0ACB9YUY7_9PEZI|nr:hypothetical protein F4820DRAFT_379745 [Hypoxylon rubiginosum]
MAHPRCLPYASPARALHRVIVSDLLSRNSSPSFSSTQHAMTYYYYLFPPRLFSSSSSSRVLARTLPIISSRPLATIPPTAHHGVHVRTLTTTPPLRRVVADAFHGRLTNKKIPYQWVRIASPPPESTLSPPQRTAAVLASLNPKKHTLVMVAPPPQREPSPEDGGGDPAAAGTVVEPLAAVCRVVDNAAASAVAKEAQRAARRRTVDSKELELSWSIAPHDLSHKLRRLRDFLDRGLSVEVLLAKKRRGRAATRDEAVAVLAAVREAVGEVGGAKEARRMDGEVGGTVKLFFEGVAGVRKGKKGREGEGDEMDMETV